MTWTTETPRVTGFYWWRKIGEQWAEVVKVDIWDPELSTVSFVGDGDSSLLHEWNKGEWAGPLEPPT
jgi:hypothetical protein